MGVDDWKSVKCPHMVYENEQHRAIGLTKIINIPYWKCSYICYMDILTFCGLAFEDYPWKIGPYPCPLSWVSYMDSTFQFRFV